MDRAYLIHLMINYTTGNKTVVDSIDNTACSVAIDPTLEETMVAVISEVYNPSEVEEEGLPEEDDDSNWDFG